MGRFLGSSHRAVALLHLLLDVMTIGSFPASLRAHGGAAAQIEKDGEEQEEKQDFLGHAFLRAQAVRAG